MKKVLIALMLCSVSGVFQAQETSDSAVLMHVDGRPVTKAEFEAIYKKNNKDASVTKEALDEYLDLFINYKLKVREAEARGMDTVQKFQKELAGYRDQLARPYLIDKELNDNLIQEAFDRSKEEVRASHLLVQVGEDAAPEDTLAAWKRISALRARVVGGEDFASVAMSKGGSDDPSAQKNGGDLGWFSALQMVYPFENAAFNTKVGEVSSIIRTRFGYHVLKVFGRRPARGQVRVAHIMLRGDESDPPERKAEAEKKIMEVHGLLNNGTITFEDAALKYSDDATTNTNGGELPAFGSGKMVEQFEDESFALKNDGDISPPFQTRYGWHIVKRLEYTPPPTFDQAKADLKSRIAKDSRADITRNAFLKKLRKDYGYKADPKALKPITGMLDSTIYQKGSARTDTMLRSKAVEGPFMENGKRWERTISATKRGKEVVNMRSRKHDDLTLSPNDTVVVRETQLGWALDRTKAAKMTKPLFTMDGLTVTQMEFLEFLEKEQKRQPAMPYDRYVERRYDEFVDQRLLAYENEHLDKKYPDFRMLMKEYRDGILLFELTDEMVWSKAVKDSTGLQAYYDAHKAEFKWDTRYDAGIYTCANAEVASEVRALYKKGNRGQEIVDALKGGSALDIGSESGLYTVDEKPFLKGISKTGLSDNLLQNGSVVLVDVKEIVPPSTKGLDEARGLVTAAYQDQLERDWIKELRGKYEVRVEKDVLYSIH